MMSNRLSVFKLGLLGMMAAGVVLAVSCSQPAPPAPPPQPSPPPTEIGRFQVVVASEGERGSMLMLVDTRDGSTWIYRIPQGAAVNGFWSDIPRVTYGAEFWQQAFRQMTQQPPPASRTNTAPAATAPGATAPEAPATR